MSCKTAARLTLTQCLNIRANQYRSANNLVDYQAEEIDERIIELQARKDERENNMALKAHARFEMAKEEIKSIPTSQNTHSKTPLIERMELVTEIKEYWKIYSENGFSYEVIEIPPQIMNF